MDDAEAIARQTSDVQRLHADAVPDLFKPPSAALYPAQKLAALLEDPNSIVAVAEIGASVIGYIYASVTNRPETEFHQTGAYIYIHQIAVDDNARRAGAGTALIRFVETRARGLGLTAVHADHLAFNGRARAFFEACGFSPLRIVMRQFTDEERGR
jgi:diamine N-acetyltransferase